jgi:threonine dehydrogenase-like Zn-dependent dehydrogenase
METMKAVVFKGKDRIGVDEVPKPRPRAGEAVIRVTTTTICGTDVHIVRGEYPVRPGLILGHEPVGVIDELGAGLEELYSVGQRVIVGAITPCGQCFYCLNAANAAAASVDGDSGTRSTAPGPSTCWSQTRARISRRFPMD